MRSPARVAVAFPVTPSATAALQTALGPNFDVTDIRTAPAESDLVVCSPCSPGAIRSLKRTFPAAQVVVVGSPLACVSVARLHDAGADVYIAGASVAHLTSVLRERAQSVPLEATLMSDCRRAA